MKDLLYTFAVATFTIFVLVLLDITTFSLLWWMGYLSMNMIGCCHPPKFED